MSYEEPAIGAAVGAIGGLFGTGITLFLLHGPILFGLVGGIGGSLLGLFLGLYRARRRQRRDVRRLETVGQSDD